MAKDDKKPAQKRQTTPVPKRSVRGRRVVQLALLFVASIIVVDTLVGDRGLLVLLQARRQYGELTTTIARLRAENTRLREEARRLRDDPAAIEDIARRELGLIRRGEKLFIVKDVVPSKAPGQKF